MPIEHEAKILDIDPDTIERHILDKGGHKLGERFMRRYVYDITPGADGKWIRLRDNGSRTTLAVKEIIGDAIDGTHEVEVSVDDFAATTKADVIRVAELLGYTEADLTGENTIKIYARHGIDLNTIRELRF